MATTRGEQIALWKAKRAEVFKELESYTLKEADGDTLTPEDADKFSELKKSVDDHDERIGRLEDVQAAAMDAAEPEKSAMDDDDIVNAGKAFRKAANVFNINTSDSIRVARKSGEVIGRYAVANWWKKEFGLNKAKDMVEKEWGDAPVSKSLTLTTAQPIIPQDFSQEFIPLLTAKSVIRKFARVMHMPNGNLTIPRQRLGSMGAFMNEGAPIPVTALAFDNLQLTWHKYGALTYTTREMLEFSPIDASNKITFDLANKMGLLEDLALTIGNGTNYPVHGIVSSVNANNISTSTGGSSPTFQTVSNDLQVAEMNLRGNLVDGNFVWVMNPYVVGFLKQLSSTFGIYPFAAELNAGMLNGFPVYTTTQLATNIGTSGANLTNILLVCADQVIIGDAYRYALSSTQEGSFLDGSTQVNTFGQDLVAWKMTNAIDFALEHDVSAAIIQATSWTLGNTTAARAEYDQAANTSASSASSAVD